MAPSRNCTGLRTCLPGFSRRCDSARQAAYTVVYLSTRQAADVSMRFRASRRMLLVSRLAWWDSDRTAGEEWSPDCLVFSRGLIWQIWLPLDPSCEACLVQVFRRMTEHIRE